MIETMLIGGKVMVPAKIEVTPEHMILEFKYNKDLLAEVKMMRGKKWLGGHPNNPVANPRKAWQIDNCPRNDFQLKRLQGLNPYAKYDTPLDIESFKFNRELRAHQKEMTVHMTSRRQCLICAEMGVGKSLSFIEAMEWAAREWGPLDAWWVAPKTALASVRLECRKWQSKVMPQFLTYDEVKKQLKSWPAGKKPPRVLCLDESSRVKTMTSQRTQACLYLADEMRKAYGDDCLIILMSGSPAPKSPVDFYPQAEIPRPGFFKEGTVDMFKYNIGIFEKVNDVAGITFPKFIGWRDGRAHLCNLCGKPADDYIHTLEMKCQFTPMVDEVSRIYSRMRGFAKVLFKKDVLDLPDKVYREVCVQPTPEILRSARLVQNTSRNAIEALTRLRELSDGFQYLDTDAGKETCTVCQGSKTITSSVDHEGNDCAPNDIACPFCNGTGQTRIVSREAVEVSAPKLKAFKELLLEEFEDDARIVTYAGFTASIDLLEDALKVEGWTIIRVDGRGWVSNLSLAQASSDQTMSERLIEAFQDVKTYPQKICFLAHPGSAGMGVTLTASRVIFYYSNDFNGESRIQSEDRIHRLGMDVNRGAMIVDMMHLPSDTLVLNNLKKKKELQAMTLGDITVAMSQEFKAEDYI